MAVKSKAGASSAKRVIVHRPKTTSIGQGQHSRPRRKGNKPYRGQGR